MTQGCHRTKRGLYRIILAALVTATVSRTSGTTQQKYHKHFSPIRGTMNTARDLSLAEATNRRAAFQGLLLTWGSHHYRELPWRRERTPYRILLAEVVLRRTTATAASKVYERLRLMPSSAGRMLRTKLRRSATWPLHNSWSWRSSSAAAAGSRAISFLIISRRI